MRKIFAYFLMTIIILSTGCRKSVHEQYSSCNKTKSTIADTLRFLEMLIPNKIVNITSQKYLDTVYVISKNGVEIKEFPYANSKTLGKLEFGEELHVLEKQEDWLGIAERINRVFNLNGNRFSVILWEKVYVDKNHVGSLNEIKLNKEDLYTINCLTINGKTKDFDKNQTLNNFLKIDFVDKDVFYEKEKTSIDYIIKDTTKVKKINSRFTLHCNSGIYSLVDDTEKEIDNYYEGYIDFLDSYLIYTQYYEDCDYKIISRKVCKELQRFRDYPHFSQDKKYLITLMADYYNENAYLELFKINDDKSITLIFGACFSHWVPLAEKFWANDGCFYAKIAPKPAILNNFDDNILNCYYIKIKPKI